MSHRLLAITLLGVMNYRDEPVTVMTNIENDIPIHRIGIPKYPSHIGKTYPASQSDDFIPCRNLFSRIRVVLCRMIQMPSRDYMHRIIIFSF